MTFGRKIGPIIAADQRRSDQRDRQHRRRRRPDLVARRGDDLVTIAHQGTFNLGRPIPTGVSLRGANAVLNVGDWDRDGSGDIVFRRAQTVR